MSSSVRIEDDTVMQPTFGRTRPARRLADATITIVVETDADTRVVRITGELDITSTAVVTRRCTDGPRRHVVVDLADLTFLDCGGYRAFVAARTTLALQHRTLTLVGAVGEPRRLLELISHLNPGEPAC